MGVRLGKFSWVVLLVCNVRELPELLFRVFAYLLFFLRPAEKLYMYSYYRSPDGPGRS